MNRQICFHRRKNAEWLKHQIHRTNHTFFVAALMLAVSAPPTWANFGVPVTLSGPGQDAAKAQVAVDADGDALVVWERYDSGLLRVQARARSKAGALGPILTLSAAGKSASVPQVGLDADGDGVIVWSGVDGFIARIQARARSNAGVLGPIQILSEGGGFGPQIGVDADGDAVIVWRRFVGGRDRIEARSRSKTGALGAVQVISAAGRNATSPLENAQVAVNASGAALIVWEDTDTNSLRQTHARARSAAGVLGPILTLAATNYSVSQPQVALDDQGDGLIIWAQPIGGASVIRARARSAGGALSAIQTLGTGGSAQVADDADGDAVVAWGHYDGANNRIQARARSKAGALGPVQTLSTAGQNTQDAQVAVDADGDAVVVWTRFDVGGGRIEARVRSKAGALGPLQILTAAGRRAEVPQVALGAAGRALAVWERSDGTNDRIQESAGP